MSSRAMKKLLRDSGGPAPLKDLEHSSNTTKDLREANEDHEGQDSDEAQEEDGSDDEYTPKQPPARNLFALVCHRISHFPTCGP